LAFVPQSKNVEVIVATPDRLDIRGALTFVTARRAYDAGLRALRKNGAPNARLLIDLSGVTESDSAGLAVLIEWLAVGTRAGRDVRFANLPEGIRAVAEIGGVADLLQPA